MKRLSFTLILLMIAVSTSFAQIETADTENRNFTVSVAGQNSNSMTAFTAVEPLPDINGHAAIQFGRQTANDEVVSENIDAQIVGQYKFAEIFIEGKRDIHRGIEWESSIGYFLTPGAVKLGPATLTGGAGNSSANTQVKDTFGITDQSRVDFNWIAYLQLDWWRTQTTVTVEPGIRFDQYQLEGESRIQYPVDEHIKVGVSVKGLFDSDPVSPDAGNFHSQYLLFATWTR